MIKIRIKVALFFINTLFKGTRFFKIKRFLIKLCGIRIGENSKVVGPIEFGTQIKLSIGDNCWIGKNICFDGNGSVTIGDNVDIAPHVVINTGGHLIGDEFRRAGEGINTSIVIGSGTWIGTNVTIINDVNIGTGVVIAAGSLINKNVEKNVMVAGVPGKIKKEL